MLAEYEHSVIIPTRNHPERLASCLASILETREPDWRSEVLVLDNSDEALRPRNEAAVVACADACVRYVSMEGVGLMAARHQGVEEARGDAISFIDDDETLCPRWFAAVREGLRDPSVGLVTGPFVPRYEDRPPSWLEHLWQTDTCGRHLGLLTLLDCGDARKDIQPAMVWGGNLTTRRRVFERVRGSHPDYLPSPWEAFQGDGEVGLTVKVGAVGLRARYLPDCAVMHAVPAERMTIEYLGRRAWFVGLHTSFTQARREHGLGPRFGVPCMPLKAARPRFERGARRVLRVARAGVTRALVPARPLGSSERTAAEVSRRLADARSRGYFWHREMLARSAQLREYVGRQDYLGSNALLPADPTADRPDEDAS